MTAAEIHKSKLQELACIALATQLSVSKDKFRWPGKKKLLRVLINEMNTDTMLCFLKKK